MRRFICCLFLAAAVASPCVAETEKQDEPVQPCGPANACRPGMFCEYTEGSCGSEGSVGICRKLVTICTMIYAPVCGCDGKTYSSDCAARAKGQSVRAKGECPVPAEDVDSGDTTPPPN